MMRQPITLQPASDMQIMTWLCSTELEKNLAKQLKKQRSIAGNAV